MFAWLLELIAAYPGGSNSSVLEKILFDFLDLLRKLGKLLTYMLRYKLSNVL